MKNLFHHGIVRSVLRMVFVLLPAFLGMQIVSAQPGTLDLTFNPLDVGFGNGDGANNGVYATARQPDGKILIGGTFTAYNGTLVNRIARLNADGTLDLTFNVGTGANAFVWRNFSLQPDGKVIICGDFTTINGIARSRIARLNSDGSLDPTFNPGTGANSRVLGTALQPDGKIIIVGEFSSYNGTLRRRIARLNADGSLDPSFDPGSGITNTSPVNVDPIVRLQADGKIIVGGNFTHYNGTAINCIVRILPDGSIDASFNPGSGANSNVQTISIQSDGKLIVAGSFTSFNGTPINRIIRLNSDGSTDASFNPGTGANNLISTSALQPDGKVIIGGYFLGYNGVGRAYLARLNSNGSLDASFVPGQVINAGAESCTLQPDGMIIVGGLFNNQNLPSRNRVIRIGAGGAIDNSFNAGTGASGAVRSIAIQPDGKSVLVGDFTQCSGIAAPHIARLLTDGSPDATFNPGTGALGNSIWTASLQSDGKIVVGGDFTFFNGVSRGRVARLNSNGSLDISFNPAPAGNTIFASAIQSDGKVLIGGDFLSYGTGAANRIARVSPTGAYDASFVVGSGANGVVQVIVLQPDGKILIGGVFTQYNGVPVNRIARLNTNGTLDPSFTVGSGANGTVNDIVVQPDGRILLSGGFTSFNGVAINRIARLHPDGTVDGSFAPGAGANNAVMSMVLQPDGMIYAGGQFNFFNASPANRIVRLNPDGSVDGGFVPGSAASDAVNCLEIQADGKVVLGGQFTSYDGVGRNRVARINGGSACSPPVISCPSDILTNNDAGACGAIVSFAVTAAGTAPTLSYTIAPGSFFPIGSTTVTAIAANACGADTCQFLVEVADNELPIAACNPVTITLDDVLGTASITASDVDGGSSDNCGLTLSVSPSTFNCSDLGVNLVTLTATDASGNESSCTAVVTVASTLAVTVDDACVSILSGYGPTESATIGASAAGGAPPYTYTWSDGSTGASVLVSPSVTTLYSVTVTDANGCTSTAGPISVLVTDVLSCHPSGEKVMLCHYPPGNPDNPQQLCIAPSALPAHLTGGPGHGNCKVGPCEDPCLSSAIGIAAPPSGGGFSMRASPNPSTGIYHIDAGGSPFAFTLLSMEGRVLLEGEAESGEVVIDLSGQPDGIYLFRAVAGEGEALIKLVKE